jgi:hypothetical protein
MVDFFLLVSMFQLDSVLFVFDFVSYLLDYISFFQSVQA